MSIDEILLPEPTRRVDRERGAPGKGTVGAMGWFTSDQEKHRTLAAAWVLPQPKRCVQCGVCSFNCPMAIDVRRHVWLRQPVVDSRCLTCGECVKRCPRGLLRFEPITDVASAARATKVR